MSNLFDRAKEIASIHLMEWVPVNGKIEGDEYVFINPTRSDEKLGSCKINVKSFFWSDFADDGAAGKDAVSLYAYLNHSDLEQKANNGKFNNIQGAIQVLAAKELLTKYDGNYFPDANDDFSQPKEKIDPSKKWDNFRYVNYKIKDIPEIDFTKYNIWGKFVESWDFVLKDRLVFKVARFIDGKKKTDIPFTLWVKNGSDIKWRPKKAQELYPLWNVDAVVNDKLNLPVFLCEGQKDASRGKSDKYIFVGWYGGAGNSKGSNWETLTGKNVYFLPDGDNAGRLAIKSIRLYAEQYDFTLTVLRTPDGAKRGYGLADAMAEGVDIETLINPPTEEKTDKEVDTFMDDVKKPFNIVGTSGSDIVFYVHGSCRIEKCKNSQLTKNFMMVMADRSWWGDMFEKEGGGCAWDTALNWLLRDSEKSPVFDFTRIRGAGAWLDGDEIIINTGEYLLINGERVELNKHVEHFLYIKSKFIPYSYKEPLTIQDTTVVQDWLKSLSWTNKVSAYALLGWITISPFGGLLRWRPHMWVIGSSGSGKSTIIEEFLHPMIINEFGIRGDGPSTPAGARQALSDSSRPFVGDEMESENVKRAENIEQILQMFRSSSSGTEGAAILMGTQDGQGQRFVVQSMALFASIGSGIKHGADANRFTICELLKGAKSIDSSQVDFEKIKHIANMFTNEFARRYHARTYRIIDEVLAAIEIFRKETSLIMGTMRDGDQLGTLLGGAFMATHDVAPTNKEAREWLMALDIASTCKNENLTDEEQCLDAIYSSQIELIAGNSRMRVNISEALENLAKMEQGLMADKPAIDEDKPAMTNKSIKDALARVGIRLKTEDMGFYIYVATSNKPLQKLLRDTPFSLIFADTLKRIDGASVSKSPTSFVGKQSRYVKVPYVCDIPF